RDHHDLFSLDSTSSAVVTRRNSAISGLDLGHDGTHGQDSWLPTGMMGGTAEDALDTACGLYLGDPTAWT
ncbi:hypothetical protein, partial [Arthrobacter sp. H5]|uniref:hypothetical protein n=1 Tax=Arthrobacter sp. H5 TaxID=1267973 RepID=UPI0005614835